MLTLIAVYLPACEKSRNFSIRLSGPLSSAGATCCSEWPPWPYSEGQSFPQQHPPRHQDRQGNTQRQARRDNHIAKKTSAVLNVSLCINPSTFSAAVISKCVTQPDICTFVKMRPSTTDRATTWNVWPWFTQMVQTDSSTYNLQVCVYTSDFWHCWTTCLQKLFRDTNQAMSKSDLRFSVWTCPDKLSNVWSKLITLVWSTSPNHVDISRCVFVVCC